MTAQWASIKPWVIAGLGIFIVVIGVLGLADAGFILDNFREWIFGLFICTGVALGLLVIA